MLACVDDKGRLSGTAGKLLETIETESLSPERISEKVNTPLFKVRSSLRDMKRMGFVNETDGQFQMNPDAKKLLDKR